MSERQKPYLLGTDSYDLNKKLIQAEKLLEEAKETFGKIAREKSPVSGANLLARDWLKAYEERKK